MNLCLATWRGYQADFNGHRTCRVGFGRGFLTALDRLIGKQTAVWPRSQGRDCLARELK